MNRDDMERVMAMAGDAAKCKMPLCKTCAANAAILGDAYLILHSRSEALLAAVKGSRNAKNMLLVMEELDEAIKDFEDNGGDK